MDNWQEREAEPNIQIAPEVAAIPQQRAQIRQPTEPPNRDIENIPEEDLDGFEGDDDDLSEPGEESDGGDEDSSELEGENSEEREETTPEDRPSILQQRNERKRNRLAPNRLEYDRLGGPKK